jgi:two-component system NtrC family response regulator
MAQDASTQGPRELPPIASAERVLRIVYSADASAAERCLPLDGREYLLGRGAHGEGTIDDARMSRDHVHIFQRSSDGPYVILDLGSRNGTHLDGLRLDAELPVPLRAGQVLAMGDTLAVVDQELDGEYLPVAPDALGEGAEEIVGSSFFSQRLRRSIATVARSGAHVLLLGAPGTGKEVTANAIHRMGTKPGAAWCSTNCATLQASLAESELFGHVKGAFTDARADRMGLLEAADGGTLFLDEIGELSPEVQAKLLRAIEQKEVLPLGAQKTRTVDVRIISATNSKIDLQTAQFRRDLLSRLTGWILRLAPLSDRRADILPLLRHFFARKGAGDRPFTAPFAEGLLLAGWPANARDLRNLVDRLHTLYPRETVLDLNHLDESLQRPIRERKPWSPEPVAAGPGPNADDGKRPPREAIERALHKTGGNVTAAARELGQYLTSVRRWIKYYGIELSQYRGGGEE